MRSTGARARERLALKNWPGLLSRKRESLEGDDLYIDDDDDGENGDGEELARAAVEKERVIRR